MASVAFLAYSITSFVGWRDSWVDLRDGLMRPWRAMRGPITPSLEPVGSPSFAVETVSSGAQLGAPDTEEQRHITA